MILDSIFIIGLYILGTILHIMQRIRKIREKYPDLQPIAVWRTYKKEEWDTMIVNGVCLGLMLSFWVLIHFKHLPIPSWINIWGSYPISLVSGYMLHRLVYKLLGTTETVIEKRIDDFTPKP